MLYKIIAVDNSVMIVTQLKIAPDNMPFDIIGTVIVKNALSFDEPKLMAASSIDIGICCNIATEDLIVYGILLIHKAITMMIAVPVNTNGLVLNPNTKAIPTTDPGMI